MIECMNCAHPCHCNEVCQDGNGCGCFGCAHLRGENMIKKLWNKIVSWLFSWQKK